MPGVAKLPWVAALAAIGLLPAARDRVQLRFAWPEEAKAKVDYTSERERIDEKGGRTFKRNSWTYDLEVHRRGDEVLVRRIRPGFTSDPSGSFWQKVDADGRAVPNFDEVQELIDAVVERIPVLVVTADGEFKKTEETEPIRQRLESILKRSALPRETQERVRALFTPAALDALAKEQWRLWVGLWRNLALERGRPVTERRRGVFPGTNYPIDLVVETRLEGFVPCAAPGTAPSCVELRVVSRPDLEQVARTIERLNLTATAGIRKLSLDQSFVVITRPETLLPHRCTRTLSAEIEHAPGSGRATRSEKLTETWAFDHAPEADRASPDR